MNFSKTKLVMLSTAIVALGASCSDDKNVASIDGFQTAGTAKTASKDLEIYRVKAENASAGHMGVRVEATVSPSQVSNYVVESCNKTDCNPFVALKCSVKENESGVKEESCDVYDTLTGKMTSRKHEVGIDRVKRIVGLHAINTAEMTKEQVKAVEEGKMTDAEIKSLEAGQMSDEDFDAAVAKAEGKEVAQAEGKEVAQAEVKETEESEVQENTPEVAGTDNANPPAPGMNPSDDTTHTDDECELPKADTTTTTEAPRRRKCGTDASALMLHMGDGEELEQVNENVFRGKKHGVLYQIQYHMVKRVTYIDGLFRTFRDGTDGVRVRAVTGNAVGEWKRADEGDALEDNAKAQIEALRENN